MPSHRTVRRTTPRTSPGPKYPFERVDAVADQEARAVVEVLRRDLPFDRDGQIVRIDVGPQPGQRPEIGDLDHHFFSTMAYNFEFVMT